MIRVRAMILTCLLVLSPAVLAAQTWEPIGTIPETGDSMNIDTSNVNRGGGKVLFTMRIDFGKPIQGKTGVATYLIAPFEVDCAKLQYRRQSETYFGADGGMLSSTKGSDWMKIQANSFGNKLRQLCTPQ